MNRKMIKEKTSKQNFWNSFKQSKTQLQQTQLVCTANAQHQKCCGTRQNVRDHKGKHVHQSKNNKTQQHSAGTPKQPPKSKTQIAFAQLGSASIHLQTNKQGAAHTSIKKH